MSARTGDPVKTVVPIYHGNDNLSAMRAASQLPGRGPTVVDMAPIPAR